MNKEFDVKYFNTFVILYVLELARNREDAILSGRLDEDLEPVLEYISKRTFVSQEAKARRSDLSVTISMNEVVMKNKNDMIEKVRVVL